MPTAPNPLVVLWQDTTRPLNWRAWQHLAAPASARLRFLLTSELQRLELAGVGQAWPWTHTHRQLLEVKAASGQARQEVADAY
jgi:hypothetical protein